MKRLLKSITAGVACIAALGGSALAQDKPEKTEITVGLPVTTSTFLPLYLAQDEGYFKNQGLNVKIVAFHGGTELVRAMIAGAVDVGVTSLAGVTIGIKAGQPIKVFYGGFDMALFDWYAVKSIKSMADTKGKRFGVSRLGSSTDFLTRYALQNSGVDPKSVQIIQGGGSIPRLAAMDAGQLDVNILASPEKFIAADKGYNLVYKQTQIAPDYPFHVFFATEGFLKKDANTVKALLRGFVKGVRNAKADKARSVETLEKRVKLDKKYAGRAYDDFIGKIYEDGRLPSAKGMQTFWKIGMMSGEYKTPWPESRYLDSTFIDSYNQWKPTK
jgi:ABC-type nitrate/sulfonate/bicarbonate transport system substrate-binding protein